MAARPLLYLDFKKTLKLWQQPVGKYYIVEVVLTKCHMSLYGSQTSIISLFQEGIEIMASACKVNTT
jgi:hypothetical protein